MLVAFGALKELVLPSDEEIDKKVKEIFTNVGLDLIEIPFALESARSSFLKSSIPLSSRAQDTRIESCLLISKLTAGTLATC